MKRYVTILILCIVFCAGPGLNLGLDSGEVSEPNPNQYQVRNCIVAECYPDEEDAGFQWVFILVTGGDYDGNVYEMRRPSSEKFHADQGLEVVFDTACTSDPTDDAPVNVLKPNMV